MAKILEVVVRPHELRERVARAERPTPISVADAKARTTVSTEKLSRIASIRLSAKDPPPMAIATRWQSGSRRCWRICHPFA